MKQVTVLIINWNGKKWLEEFLPTVLASTYPSFEILVADNASSDGSLDYLAQAFPTVRTLSFSENHGFAGGNNRAMAHIESPYVALLNNDAEVSPGWLEPLVALMEANPLVAAVQPKILAQRNKAYFEYAGASGGYIDRYYYPFCRGRIFDTLEPDKGQYDTPAEIFWATGACCMVRKKVIDEIGLFEPAFFAHMEEIDFCWRAKNFGYQIMCQPESVVYHVGGGSLPQGNPRKTFLNVRNSLAMMYMNLPAGQRFSRIFIRLLLDGVWGMKSLVGGDFGTLRAILQAHVAFYGKLRLWGRRRSERYAAWNPVPPVAGYYSQSIVWQYYVRGIKSWKDLQI